VDVPARPCVNQDVVALMELGLNLLWLLLAVASLSLVWRGEDLCSRAGWQAWRRILALACALVIFFPVISLTDDLHAAPLVMEDSNPARRLAKSSAAPGAAARLYRSLLPFTVAAGLKPDAAVPRLGLLAAWGIRFLAAAPVRRPNLRGPPSPV